MLEHATIDGATTGVAGPAANDELVSLEQRLQRGWDLMIRAEQRDEPTDELFSHFTLLLRQYEDLVDAESLASAI